MKSAKTPIDWAQVHRRVESAQARLAQEFTPTPEEQKRILHARAQALAREEAARSVEYVQVVEFRLSNETYGVDSSFVQEACPLRQLTPLPGIPSFILGLMNLRGRILSVVDLGQFFVLPARGLTDLSRVLVLHSPQMEFGLLADAVLGMRQIPLDELQSGLPTLTGIRADYLKGVTPAREIILDAEKILSDERLIVRDQVV